MFITGGTGFVGKWLLEALLHADRSLGLGMGISVLTRSPDAFAVASPHLAQASAVELVRGDILDLPQPTRPYTSVIHAALPVATLHDSLANLETVATALIEAGVLRHDAMPLAQDQVVARGAVWIAFVVTQVGCVQAGQQFCDRAGTAQMHRVARARHLDHGSAQYGGFEAWVHSCDVNEVAALLRRHWSIRCTPSSRPTLLRRPNSLCARCVSGM